MSILLSSGKGAAAKIREGNRAGKKKPEKVKKSHSDAAQFHSYLPTEGTAVWNVKINGVDYSLALDKESLDLWCNDNIIDAEGDFNDTGSTMEFDLGGRKARIKITPSSRGTKYEFTLGGETVPQVN